jgi:type VI secretion system secreted protein VgrG
MTATRLCGEEGVDGLYCYSLTLKTPDSANFAPGQASNMNLDGFIGKEISVQVELADAGGGVREINALVTEARFLREEGRNAYYELTLRPWLYLATLRSDCKIYQDMTVVELLDDLLAGYGFPVKKALSGSYPKRDYQTQYNETDFDFFARLCEEWGISYYFEHEDGVHRLTLVDEMSAWQKNPNARYQQVKFHVDDEQAEEEYLDALVPMRRITSGKYATRDYDYMRPRADLSVGQSDPRETAQNDYEIFDWHAVRGGRHYVQPKAGPGQASNEPLSEGDLLTKLRMQAQKSQGWRAKGGGALRGMVAGHTFQLVEHPADAANVEYLILHTRLLVEEVAEESQSGSAGRKGNKSTEQLPEKLRRQEWHVRVDVELHPMQEVYRVYPTRMKPVAAGPETALVVGPEGENIWTDELGRIKVQFHWDRYAQKDENASCWVRVSSSWAGNQLGGLHLPRIGQEVIISYLEGDPDLPVCTGRVSNQANLPPWRLPDQQALSGFRSRELVAGGGNAASGKSNTLILDDSEGKIQGVLRSDHLSSQLTVGYVTRIEDYEGRKDGRGEGFELRTDGHGVVRSGAGLYVTTQARVNAEGPMKDMAETVDRLEQGKKQQETLAEVGNTFEADLGEQNTVAQKLKEANEAIKGEGSTDEKAGKFPEFKEAHLVLASAQSLHVTSERSTQVVAGDHFALTSGRHVSLSIGKRFLASVTDGVRYFVRQAGMKFIAAADDIDIKALKDNLNLFAKLEIKEEANRITLKAKEEILIAGGGSYIRINASGIENGTPGTWSSYASNHVFAGPKSLAVSLPSLPKVGEGELEILDLYANAQGLEAAPYKVVDVLGKTLSGSLSGAGQSFESGLAPGPAQVFLKKDPRLPSQDANKFGVKLPWPEQTPEVIADLGSLSAVTQGISSFMPAAAGGVMPGAEETTGVAGLPGISSVPGWGGGNIPLGKNLPRFDPSNKLEDLAGQGMNTFMQALPEQAMEVVTQGQELAGALSTLKRIADDPQSLLAGVVSVPEMATPRALPSLSTPPFAGATEVTRLSGVSGQIPLFS